MFEDQGLRSRNCGTRWNRVSTKAPLGPTNYQRWYSPPSLCLAQLVISNKHDAWRDESSPTGWTAKPNTIPNESLRRILTAARAANVRVVYNRVAYDDEGLRGVAKEGGGDMPQVGVGSLWCV